MSATTETDQTTPAPAAKKATSSRTKKLTPDQALAYVQGALTDPDHEGHAEVTEHFESLVADRLAEQPTTQAPRNVVEAIVAVMRDVRAVGKDGTNEKQRYNFRGIDGTVNAIGPAMRAHGLIVTPTLRRFEYGEVEVGRDRTKQAHAQVEVEYTFSHSNADGVITNLVATVPGESMDSGDKGTAKAMSVAFRICLLQQFAVPTMERDPDADAYERSPAPTPISEQVIRDDCNTAAAWDDLDDAFAQLRAHHTSERLAVSTVVYEGKEYDGNAFLDFALEKSKQHRAEQARKQQDAQGDAQEPDAQEPDARAPEGEDARTEPEPERAPEPGPGQYQGPVDETRPGASTPAEHEAAQRAKSEPKESPKDKMVRLAQEELAFQAEVLGQNLMEYAQPALIAAGDLSTLHMSRAMQFLTGQRPAVIDALRARGDATIAEKYTGIGKGFPLVLDKILEGGEGTLTREPVNQ